MTLIQITDDLVVECWPSGGEKDRALLVIRSLSQGADGETPPGMLIVYAEEVELLIEALNKAAEVLAEYEAQR